MENVSVTDLYEAAYFLMNGFELKEVECIPISGKLSCRLSFSGENLNNLQDSYFKRTVKVNLFAFRQSYNTINSYIHQAKKNYNMNKKREELV